jgi:DNA-directed RNA polymerase subunit M/transcription elongation factor TFIIS
MADTDLNYANIHFVSSSESDDEVDGFESIHSDDEVLRGDDGACADTIELKDVDRVRSIGVAAIGLVSSKAVRLEELLHRRLGKGTTDFSPVDETSYKKAVYSVCGTILTDTKYLESAVKSRPTEWGSYVFDEPRYIMDEEDSFMTTPPEVESGVLVCNKCGSDRTFSYSKQTRGGDEATTIFSTCAECGTKWTE